VAGLTILMSIPALFVADIINERADYNRETIRDVGREWGGNQVIRGPVLVIPVEETVTERVKREVIDPVTGIQQFTEDGHPVIRVLDQTKIVQRAPIFLLPQEFSAKIDTSTQERYRGFFSVPVYTAEAALQFDFAPERAQSLISGDARILWDQAELRLRVTSNRALRGEARLSAGARDFTLEPLTSQDGKASGFQARLGDPRGQGMYELKLGMFGAGQMMVSPVGRQSTVEMRSDWPHPSFTGAFLPDSKTISEAGFDAQWRIPHLARSMPQMARFDQTATGSDSAAFGVSYYQPNDFYQKSFRAARYGLMFIALTFLAIFLLDGRSDRPTHPVQYVLIGTAQLTFFLMMVALAEQLGFAMAYGLAGGATVGLITLFAALALRFGKLSVLLGGVLSVLYAVLYAILQSSDYALLAGSMLAFAAIAATMFATRNEDGSCSLYKSEAADMPTS